jgi:hypothetical protein
MIAVSHRDERWQCLAFCGACTRRRTSIRAAVDHHSSSAWQTDVLSDFIIKLFTRTSIAALQTRFRRMAIDQKSHQIGGGELDGSFSGVMNSSRAAVTRMRLRIHHEFLHELATNVVSLEVERSTPDI